MTGRRILLLAAVALIATACATADVNVTSKIVRRITTLHCVVAFFFNTTILALPHPSTTSTPIYTHHPPIYAPPILA